MSRSLDKDLLANLKSEDPTTVYRDISKILTSLPETGLLEIELLGQSHPLETGVNFLRDENAVAIPKLRLVQAFFVARQLIQKHLGGPGKAPNQETVEATAVVLLMDSEHLTAANMRKRAVQSTLEGGGPAELLLLKEKQFVDSLLTARLHRHTKSPTLWSHRRWLIEKFQCHGLTIDVREDLVKVIMVSGERHPRNYYAWNHARELLLNARLEARVLAGIVDDVKDWCFRHHNDISGWTYLGFVVLNFEEEAVQLSKCTQVLTETLNIAESFRWTNESVWTFLRTLIAEDLVAAEVYMAFSKTIQSLMSGVGEDLTAKKTLDEAQRWSCKHRSTT